MFEAYKMNDIFLSSIVGQLRKVEIEEIKP